MAITGFDITNAQFDLNDTDPRQLDSVTFTTDAAADEVWVVLHLVDLSITAGIACIGDVPQTGWTCDLTGDATRVGQLSELGVYAASTG